MGWERRAGIGKKGFQGKIRFGHIIKANLEPAKTGIFRKIGAKEKRFFKVRLIHWTWGGCGLPRVWEILQVLIKTFEQEGIYTLAPGWKTKRKKGS